jgi:hypothetical protein
LGRIWAHSGNAGRLFDPCLTPLVRLNKPRAGTRTVRRFHIKRLVRVRSPRDPFLGAYDAYIALKIAEYSPYAFPTGLSSLITFAPVTGRGFIMTREKQTNWHALVGGRWPGWQIEGNGPFAVVDQCNGVIRLHAWPLGAQADCSEAPWGRKLYRLERAPGTPTVKLPREKGD